MEVARIFKSTDGGGQWRDVAFPVPPDPGRTVIRALAIDPATPSIVYASYDTCTAGGCNGGGVYKSTDGGESWVLARNGMSGAGPVTALAIDPAAPARIYAGTAHGVFASDDRAASWTPINSGLTSLSVFGLSIDRTGSILRAATADGLFEYAFFEPSAFGTVQVIEYHHPAFDDYFITADPHEIRLLDDGAVTGWVRTGLHFNAYAASNANSVPVCRFLRTTLGPHFFTPFATECATTQTDAGWMLETTDAFDIALPAADGSCAEGFTRVYRLYNNGQGGAPAHRYTTDAGVRAEMIGQGWVAEGVGPQAVQMCSPP